MSSHRLVSASAIRKPISTARPFSNFDFVDEHYGGEPAIRRLFSQARSYGYRTLLIEDIPATGTLAEDDAELAGLFHDFQPDGLQRLSFWKSEFEAVGEIPDASPNSLLGFAILKRDVVPSRRVGRWYVFESVFIKYAHRHNCVPGGKSFRVRIADGEFAVSGVLYCQQNYLNKACAQVALRSLLATRYPDEDLSYRQINEWAFEGSDSPEPWNGLNVEQIRRVLRGRGLGFFDLDFERMREKGQGILTPYQKLLYSGIESGAGALLGFRWSGAGLKEEKRHIIPFFGHTFNQDSWVPHAEAAYFHIGERTKFLPSESWASSFIGHDDNFGSNFCVPRLYIPSDQVDYTAELFLDGCACSGTMAEAVAIDYLYSLYPLFERPELKGQPRPWLHHLWNYVGEQQVVLRSVCVTAEEYNHHWAEIKDWEGNEENRELCTHFRKILPDRLWMVEVSVPELFPANNRKVGEIVLDATEPPSSERDLRPFVRARMPGALFLLDNAVREGKRSLNCVPSQLLSHTPLYGCERGPVIPSCVSAEFP